MTSEDKWLDWAVRLQALAQNGLAITAVGVSWGLGQLDEHFKISEGIKDWWAGVIKD